MLRRIEGEKKEVREIRFLIRNKHAAYRQFYKQNFSDAWRAYDRLSEKWAGASIPEHLFHEIDRLNGVLKGREETERKLLEVATETFRIGDGMKNAVETILLGLKRERRRFLVSLVVNVILVVAICSQ